ncbi:hypothetical protein CEXT_19411 [Caerostris extrusa]|uniref:Uncharacterized protein n=1 Tax=Caerostris extrusa TaxID=172846 RepID=A0AAV4SLC1_CAEEX|nr:hypothetical protein CEXT_19411 [Caerostris extrusa]
MYLNREETERGMFQPVRLERTNLKGEESELHDVTVVSTRSHECHGTHIGQGSSEGRAHTKGRLDVRLRINFGDGMGWYLEFWGWYGMVFRILGMIWEGIGWYLEFWGWLVFRILGLDVI